MVSTANLHPYTEVTFIGYFTETDVLNITDPRCANITIGCEIGNIYAKYTDTTGTLGKAVQVDSPIRLTLG